jgi:hypothetical protein
MRWNNPMTRIVGLLPVAAIAASLVLSPGCAQLDLKSPMHWFGGDTEPSVPDSVVAFWTDAVRHQAGTQPERGFGGRIFFYKGKSAEPVRVEGTLTIYAFDEEQRDPTDARPDRKYVFLPHQFDKHFSDAPELGPSYSVWLPWEPVGGPPKEISLIVRFVPEQGGVVVGEQTRHWLPGISSKKESNQQKTDGVAEDDPSRLDNATIRRTAYEETVQERSQRLPDQDAGSNASETGRRMKMKTTTIPVRSRFGRQPPAVTRRQKPTVPVAAPVESAGQSDWASEPVASPPEAGSRPTTARFSLSRSRALGEPIARLQRDHARWPQPPAASQSLPPTRLPPTTRIEYPRTAPTLSGAWN